MMTQDVDQKMMEEAKQEAAAAQKVIYGQNIHQEIYGQTRPPGLTKPKPGDDIVVEQDLTLTPEEQYEFDYEVKRQGLHKVDKKAAKLK